MTQRMPFTDKYHARRHFFWLFSCLALAIGARFTFIRDVIGAREPLGLIPIGTDSFYHLWRIETAVATGTLPRFDSFMNTPIGAHVIYPDGFAYILASAARLIFGADASRESIQWTAMLGCVVLGVSAVYAIYFMARSLFGYRAGIIAMFIAAILPIAVFTGAFGQVDHHSLEFFLSALALTFIVRNGHNVPDAPYSASRHRRDVAAAAVCLAALHYCVPTAPIHILLVFVALEVGLFRAADNEKTLSHISNSASGAFLLAAILCVPDVLSRRGFAFYEPSLLTPLLLLVAAFSVQLTRATLLRVRRDRVILFVALGAVCCLGVLFILYPDAADFVQGRGTIGLIAEAQPIWRMPRNNFDMHGLFIIGAPFVFPWLMIRGGAAIAGMAAFGMCSLGLAALQIRFGYMLATSEAILFGGALSLLWSRPMKYSILKWILIPVGVLPLLWTVYATRAAVEGDAATRQAINWLRMHTPDAGSRTRGATASYTILAPWDLGTQIAYWANRPVIAGGFFHGDYAQGVDDTIRLFYGEDDPTSLFAKHRIKYVVVDERFDRTMNEYMRLNPRTGRLLRLPLHFQLFAHDGSVATAEGTNGATRFFPALGNLRLFFLASVPDSRTANGRPYIKIFQVIPGADLVGACSGDAVQAVVRVPVETTPPIDFISWVNCSNNIAATAADARRYQLTIPYSGDIQISENNNTQSYVCKVTDEDIAQGHTVHCRR